MIDYFFLRKQNAHSAGITCLKLGKGTKGSLWYEKTTN